MLVTSLRRYPVKSLAGLDEPFLDVAPGGPVGDRRWAVVDPDGRTITARVLPELLRLRPRITEAGLTVTAPGGQTIDVPTPVDGPLVPVDFSRLESATDAGDRAAEFLTQALGRELRLVWQADVRARSINAGNGGIEGEVLSLADAGPLLLTSEASLAQLQSWVGPEPQLSMVRFRPNVVLDGATPFEEDEWKTARIGDQEFRVQQTCDRCVFTTIDPDTLAKGPEPIRTLAKHRKWNGSVWFGIWLVPRGSGRISVGDELIAT